MNCWKKDWKTRTCRMWTPPHAQLNLEDPMSRNGRDVAMLNSKSIHYEPEEAKVHILVAG